MTNLPYPLTPILRHRGFVAVLLAGLGALIVCARPGWAQEAPAEEPYFIWSSFVSGVPGQSARRSAIDEGGAGVLNLGSSRWACGFGAQNVARITDQNWSVQRVLLCELGDASVSATASCRLSRDGVQSHAASLSLADKAASGAAGQRHITVTLECRQNPRHPSSA